MTAGFSLRCLLLAACLTISGCLTFPAHIVAEMAPVQAGEVNPFVRRLTADDRAAFFSSVTPQALAYPTPALSDLPLASGQIVVFDDTHPRGFFSSLMSADYHPWTHIGIISLEPDGPVVYDTDGEQIYIPGLPPNTLGVGGVRRIPLDQYVGGSRLMGIYALPSGVDAAKVVAFARMHYERGTPFDHFFDPRDSGALYCAELVALALEAGGAPAVRPVPMRVNRSYAVIREWLRMRSPGLVIPGQLVDPDRLVAKWRPGLSPAQINAHFEIRRELLRRFDPEIRIGLMLGWDDGLFLREDVEEFAVSALANFRAFEGNADSIRREVRRLADLFFGEWPVVATGVSGQPSQR